ncbi:iron-containing alcohol dehydrogenase [Actinotignum urinale]|uniref:iron-containing alcohol dehydrogenase n=1 Tax=Actinotignum urinale TaxID=190146 RepID=UPI00280BE5D6|nr:iron-containing alcohol dehydrogenase [Actinotignum urinale]
MINNFTLQVATTYIFGSDAEESIGKKLADSGYTTALVHYEDKSHAINSGLLDKVIANLHREGLKVIRHGGVVPNPRLHVVENGIALAKSNHVDVIIAIGGGSVIDSSKAIALGAANTEPVWDYFQEKLAPEKTLPVAVVLTNPSSGSEASQVSVITNRKTGEKLTLSNPLLRPAFAFMNPELSTTVPLYATACGIVDMFSHICERYFTPSHDFGFVDYLAEGALRAIVQYGELLVQHPRNVTFRSEMMWASTMAQNNILCVGREEDWSTHIIANEISAKYDVAHGATLSIIMCSWMRYVYESNPRRFARFAREVFGVRDETMDFAEQAKQGIEATRAFFQRLGMPTSFHDADIPTGGVEDMLNKIHFGPHHTIGSVQPLNREDCAHIFEASF